MFEVQIKSLQLLNTYVPKHIRTVHTLQTFLHENTCTSMKEEEMSL